MRNMSTSEIEQHLSGPHQAVLSVSRTNRGPVAVPMSYLFAQGRFFMITSPDSVHGRLMQQTGRATMTVQFEEQSPGTVTQWYVIAEGPIGFTDDEAWPLVRAVMAKDRGEELADAWTAHSWSEDSVVAVLVPERLSGYFNTSRLE